MRALLVTSAGVTCAVALTLPLAAAAAAVPAPDLLTASSRPPSTSPASPGAGPPAVRAGAAEPAGSTQSLPLAPLAASSDRV
ncbi:N-acetylmuramoyl-L-alanine amidase, partial [Streptomyces sp. ZEA17I]